MCAIFVVAVDKKDARSNGAPFFLTEKGVRRHNRVGTTLPRHLDLPIAVLHKPTLEDGY
jgi:hypothetical protein